jgi:hypothetical protein
MTVKKKFILFQGTAVMHDVLHDAYFSPNIVLVIVSRRMTHRMSGGRRELLTGICWGNLIERANLDDLGLDGRVM